MITHHHTASGLRYKTWEADETAEPVSVIVHLHGATLGWRALDGDLHAMADVIGPQVLVVAPHDPNGWTMWANSADGTVRRADEILEMTREVEATRATTGHRILQGFSMGGFGAATIGMRNPDLFDAVMIWDGALHTWETLQAMRPHIARDQYAHSEDHFQEWSPWSGIQPSMPVFVAGGMLADWADRYATFVEANGGNVELHQTPCGHDLACMAKHLATEARQFIAGVWEDNA